MMLTTAPLAVDVALVASVIAVLYSAWGCHHKN